jgi:hypothetical protein
MGKSGLFHSRSSLKLADFVPSLWFCREGAGQKILTKLIEIFLSKEKRYEVKFLEIGTDKEPTHFLV